MMKQTNKLLKALPLLLTLNISIFTCFAVFSQIGAAINTTGAAADASSVLDVSSTSAGMLVPRMTKTERNAINSPAEGLLIYQTDDTVGFWYCSGNLWKLMGSGAGSAIANGTAAGNTLYWDGSQWVESPNIYNAGGSVGIGTNTPNSSAKFEISSITGGTLITRMTTTERDAIQNPAEGLQIFNLTTKCFEFFGNYSWNQISCAFACGNVFIDNRDGQYYQTVKIGTQCWMSENLKYLPAVVGVGTGSSIASYYYVYGYDSTDVSTAKTQSNYSTYGVLYNWQASTTACPSGWHLPSDVEWQQLEISLGMDPVIANNTGWRGTDEGNKLKEAGILHWTSPNAGSTNSTGFTALPVGYRSTNQSFRFLGNIGYWWTATEDNSSVWVRYLYYSSTKVGRDISDKGFGFGARCLRN